MRVIHLNHGDEKLERQEPDVPPHANEVLDEEGHEPVAPEKSVRDAFRRTEIRWIGPKSGSSVQKPDLFTGFFGVKVFPATLVFDFDVLKLDLLGFDYLKKRLIGSSCYGNLIKDSCFILSIVAFII